MNQESSEFKIQEITTVDSPYLAGMKMVLKALFPKLTPVIEKILDNRFNTEGQIQKQIFVGICGESIAGILQIFYHPWRGGLLSVIDLMGVLESFRSTGLGLSLMRYAISATKDIAFQWKVSPKGLLWLTELDQGNYNSWAARRVKLYEKTGAQVRRDIIYQFNGQPETDGEMILWYPISDDVVKIGTKELAWALWQSGGLPPEEFTERYGSLNNV